MAGDLKVNSISLEVYSLKKFIKILTIVFSNVGRRSVSCLTNVYWLSDLKRSRAGEIFTWWLYFTYFCQLSFKNFITPL